jgi:hypothetical protein
VNMISLLVEFLILRVMIRYNIIPLSSLSSLIDAPHQLFACIKYIIQLMILALWLASEVAKSYLLNSWTSINEKTWVNIWRIKNDGTCRY